MQTVVYAFLPFLLAMDGGQNVPSLGLKLKTEVQVHHGITIGFGITKSL